MLACAIAERFGSASVDPSFRVRVMTTNIRHAIVWATLGATAAVLAFFSMVGVSLPG